MCFGSKQHTSESCNTLIWTMIPLLTCSLYIAPIFLILPKENQQLAMYQYGSKNRSPEVNTILVYKLQYPLFLSG